MNILRRTPPVPTIDPVAEEKAKRKALWKNRLEMAGLTALMFTSLLALPLGAQIYFSASHAAPMTHW